MPGHLLLGLRLRYFPMKRLLVPFLAHKPWHDLSYISATPKEGLYDVETKIRVAGLSSGEEVTLKAQMNQANGKILHSNAHFVANAEGIVDLAEAPSVGGSYKGVFPAGLLATLSPSASKSTKPKVETRNKITDPLTIHIHLQNGHRGVDDAEFVTDRVSLTRRFMAPGVKRIPVKEGRLRGVLYLPEGEGPFPGVIDMFGITGMLFDKRAALNASRGIASFALAYYNYEDIPDDWVFDFDFEYFEEALQFLLSQPTVIPDKAGVVGTSYGGLIAFLMASYLEKIQAAFIINSGPNCAVGNIYYRGNIIKRKLDVTLYENMKKEEGNLVFKENVFEATSAIDENTVNDALRADKCQFAVAIAGDDSLKPKEIWNNLLEILKQKKTNNFDYKIYPNAGHLILHYPNLPFRSLVKMSTFIKEPKEKYDMYEFGGSPLGNYNMEMDTWKWMYNFFQKNLGNK